MRSYICLDILDVEVFLFLFALFGGASFGHLFVYGCLLPFTSVNGFVCLCAVERERVER